MGLVLHQEVLLVLFQVCVALDVVGLRAEGILASNRWPFLLEEKRLLGSILNVLGCVLQVLKAYRPQVGLLIFLALAQCHQAPLG